MYVCLFHSEKRVGNVYAKAKSFVDYVRRALRRLELDESKVRARILQLSYNTFQKQTVESASKNANYFWYDERENVSSLVFI